MGSNPSTAYFHIMVHQPSASWDHWRSAHWTIHFVDRCSSLSLLPSGEGESSSSLPVVVLRVNTAQQKKRCLYTSSSFPILNINFKINFNFFNFFYLSLTSTAHSSNITTVTQLWQLLTHIFSDVCLEAAKVLPRPRLDVLMPRPGLASALPRSQCYDL